MCVLSETHLKKKNTPDIISINNYDIIRKDREGRRGGGVAIILKNNIKYKESIECIPNSEYELLWIELTFDHNIVILGALYHPPKPNYRTEDFIKHLEDTVYIINENYGIKSQIILAGDFNTMPNNQLIESTGLLEIVDRPTHEGNQLDRIYVSNVWYEHIKVFRSTINTDHMAVLTSSEKITLPYKKTKKKHSVRIRTPAQIALFHQNITNVVFETENLNTQELFDNFYENLTSMLDTYFPTREVTLSDRDPLFVTPYIKLLLREKNKLMRKGEYIKANKITVKISNQISYNNSQRFRNLTVNNSKQLWTNIKNEIFHHKVVQDPPNNVTSESLNHHYCNMSTDNTYELPTKKSTVKLENVDYFDPVDIHRSLAHQKRTATGTDNLPYWYLKIAADYIYNHLTYIINHSLLHSVVPTQWKLAQIHPIAKIKEPQTPSDFRPISITPIISRITEKLLIKKYFSNIFKERNTSKDFTDQFGFRPTGSTTAAITACINEISNMLENNKYVRLISLDFSKAFDTVKHSMFFIKLSKYITDDSLFNWFIDLFNDHMQRTKYNEETSEYSRVNAGVIQGSAVGPFAFCIVASDLRPISTHNVIIKYADDTCIIIPESNIRTTDNELRNVEEWANSNNLKLNQTKSKEIVFRRPRITEEIIPETINNIARVSHINILGVTFDHNLSVKIHIDNILDKIGYKLYILKILKSKGLQMRELTSVFTAIILSGMLYAVQAWWGFANAQEKSRLESILRRCIRWNFCQIDEKFQDLVRSLDQRLFNSIRSDYSHVLHRYLPAEINHNYNTRRTQPFNINIMTNTISKNFIHRYILSLNYTLS